MIRGSEESQPHPDSAGRDRDFTSQWGECQGICSHFFLTEKTNEYMKGVADLDGLSLVQSRFDGEKRLKYTVVHT